ncbi:unnamed protein product [Lactuca saligna]|uniref:Uncharacterized protein n=1 Tax=Lactuca saligna TaxID=75948 RepID=A0AA35YYH4_LACSI|nr:unnamed protein product [Lactuca saligna]
MISLLQLHSPDASPSMNITALRTLSHTLKTFGEEVLDDTAVAALSNSSPLVRCESTLTLRALAEIDPTCVGGLVSYGITTLKARRENVSFGKGNNLCLLVNQIRRWKTRCLIFFHYGLISLVVEAKRIKQIHLRIYLLK